MSKLTGRAAFAPAAKQSMNTFQNAGKAAARYGIIGGMNGKGMYILGALIALLIAAYLALHIAQLLRITRQSKAYLWGLCAAASISLLALALLSRSLFSGFLAYSLCCFFLVDIVRLLIYWLFKNTALMHVGNTIYLRGLLPLMLALLISAGGYFNAQNRQITTYEVQLSKPLEAPLHIVMLSDMHIGDNVFEEDIAHIVARVNALYADIVLLCGDIFTETTTPALLTAALDAFAGIQAEQGVFYVPGNHEYYDSSVFHVEALSEQLRAAGVVLLVDEALAMPGGYTLIGRQDASRRPQPLSALLAGVDTQKPIILMDHQLHDLEAHAALGVDLQFSGHTHAGQLFPLGQFCELLGIYEMNYGLRKQNGYHCIVSAGVGTLAFPMRVGSPCEIVSVRVQG